MTNVDRILRMKQLPAVVGLRPAMIYRLVQHGKFPKPFKLTDSGRATGWRESEVLAWIESRERAA